MDTTHSGQCCGLTRRGFLLGMGVGAVAGAGLVSAGPLAWRHWFLRADKKVDPELLLPFTGRSREVAKPVHAMPGPFPGRIIEVRHPGSVTDQNEIQSAAVRTMMNRGRPSERSLEAFLRSW
jgi:hypothetical protein